MYSTGAFSAFTMLYNDHLYQVPEYVITPKEKHSPDEQSLPVTGGLFPPSHSGGREWRLPVVLILALMTSHMRAAHLHVFFGELPVQILCLICELVIF